MSADTDELRCRIAKLRPGWDPEGLSGFLFLEGGYSNDNYLFTYLGERYVLRRPYRRREFVDRGLEARLYRDLAPGTGPDVLALDTESGCMISRWVAGALLADVDADPDRLTAYLRDLHGGLPPLERDYDPLAQARSNLERCSAPVALERAASKRWEPEDSAPCHNDLNPWNVICASSGRWITLDWEWAGRNDPLFDLVTLHQGAALAPEALPAMAERYLDAPPSAERLERCIEALWLRETTWALAELAAGNDRPEIHQQRRIGMERLESLAR